MCGMVQGRSYLQDWIPFVGPTPDFPITGPSEEVAEGYGLCDIHVSSFSFLPSSLHDLLNLCASDVFMYVSGRNHRRNDKVRLISPRFPSRYKGVGKCLEFEYLVNGPSIDILRILDEYNVAAWTYDAREHRSEGILCLYSIECFLCMLKSLYVQQEISKIGSRRR